jgi:hypothetical protein
MNSQDMRSTPQGVELYEHQLEEFFTKVSHTFTIFWTS